MFYLWKATIFPQANTVLESYYLPLTTVCVVCRLPRCYVMHARNFLALFPEDALRAMREKALAFSNAADPRILVPKRNEYLGWTL